MTVVKVAGYVVAAVGLAGGVGVCAAHIVRRRIERDLDRLSDWRRRG